MWDGVGVSQCQYVAEKLEEEEAVAKQPVSQTLSTIVCLFCRV